MKNRTLRVMELLGSSQSPVAKFMRIQRSIAAFPVLAVYAIVGSYFTQLNFFVLKFFLGAVALYLLCVAVNGYNNLFDLEEDKLATTSGIVKANYLLKEFTMKQLTWNFILTSIALAVVLVYLGNLGFAAVCAFTFALGIVYTKPIRLKNIPFVGTLSNSYLFSFVPILSAFFLLNGELRPTIAFTLVIYLPAFAGSLIAEIADKEVDEKIGTRTTALWLGSQAKSVLKAVVIVSVVLFFGALYLHWAVILTTPFMLAILYETRKLYLDFSDKKADYALILIGANISRVLIIYVLAAIVLHAVAAPQLAQIF